MASQVDQFWGPVLDLHRGQLVQGSVRSGSVEMRHGDDPAQVPLVDVQYPVQQFPAQAADHPLADRVRSGRLRRTSRYPNPLGGEHSIERGGEPGVPIAQQELGDLPVPDAQRDQSGGFGMRRQRRCGSQLGQRQPAQAGDGR